MAPEALAQSRECGGKGGQASSVRDVWNLVCPLAGLLTAAPPAAHLSGFLL